MATIIGTEGDDTRMGSQASDVIYGLGGDDHLIGGAGTTTDLLFGDDGNDLLEGGGGGDDMWGGDGNDDLHGQDGDDRLWGGNGADDLFGGDGDDRLASFDEWDSGVLYLAETPYDSGHDGGPGDENDQDLGATMSGGAGNDVIFTSNDYVGTMTVDGGADNDTLVFGGDHFILASGTNTVDLESESGRTAFGETLIVRNVENITGGRYNDVLRGTDGANVLRGGSADDRLEGRGGADTLDGGFGRDVVDYYSSTSGVDVDLARTTQSGGDAAGDTLVGFEDIDGSAFGSDTLRGNGSSNILFGNGGNDTLEGRGGADTLNGGFGSDTASYASSNAGVTVGLEDQSLGVDSYATGGHATGDTLISIENLTGSAYGDTLMGNASGNRLDGGGGDDILHGADGEDTLTGGHGSDRAQGGDGDDTIDGGFGSDVLEGDQGTDTVSFQSWDPTGFYTPAGETIRIVLGNGSGQGTATRTVLNLNTLTTSVVETDTLIGFENVTGSNRSETIVGNSGSNTLDGRGGDDVLQGNAGNDTLRGGSGSDTVSYANNSGHVIVSLGTGQATEFATFYGQPYAVGTDSLNGIENVTGSAFNDTIIGNDAANVIDGGGGADTMAGGRGNDRYFVDNPSDQPTESADEGTDEVFLSFNGYVLSANVENLTLLDGVVAGLGNGLDNRITGNSAANVIIGNGGDDTMEGRGGDDSYVVDSSSDEVVELGGQGDDIVYSSADYTLSDNVETLSLFGGTAIRGTGNAQDNTIHGNAENNILDGRGGVDSMVGYGGDDSYNVDDTDDLVTEDAGAGHDIVYSTVDYTLTDNVEDLSLFDGAGVVGSGNDLANTLYGSKLDNELDGRGGADVLTGLGGNDTFVFRAGEADGDTVVEFDGNGAGTGDRLRFEGYGTLKEGASFTQINATDWIITSADGLIRETITLSGAPTIDGSDFQFV